MSFIQRAYLVMWQPFPAAACHAFERLARMSTPGMQRDLDTIYIEEWLEMAKVFKNSKYYTTLLHQ